MKQGARVTGSRASLKAIAAVSHAVYSFRVLPEENRARIAAWIDAAPDRRVVEIIQRGDSWQSRAIQAGEVLYEEAELREQVRS